MTEGFPMTREQIEAILKTADVLTRTGR